MRDTWRQQNAIPLTRRKHIEGSLKQKNKLVRKAEQVSGFVALATHTTKNKKNREIGTSPAASPQAQKMKTAEKWAPTAFFADFDGKSVPIPNTFFLQHSVLPKDFERRKISTAEGCAFQKVICKSSVKFLSLS